MKESRFDNSVLTRCNVVTFGLEVRDLLQVVLQPQERIVEAWCQGMI